VLPFAVAIHLTRHGDLADPGTKKRFDSFYRSLRVSEGKLILLEPVWFFLRRLIIGVAVVFLTGPLIWQVLLLTLTVVVQFRILGHI